MLDWEKRKPRGSGASSGLGVCQDSAGDRGGNQELSKPVSRELGLADSVKMIPLSPAALTYASDNIRGKIAGVRDLGFADPVNTR